MSSGAFARGAHAMINSMFFKLMIRKTYYKKSSADTLCKTMKLDTKALGNNKSHIGETDNNCWVPHERTGIYHPKGQEKVMEGIPPGAGKDVNVINWFSPHEEY